MRFLVVIPMLAVAGAGAAGLMFTSAKIHKMKQIRGFEPGASISKHVVLDKAPAGGDSVWILWAPGDISRRGHHRLNLPRRLADRHQVGDEIEIVRLPGSGAPYHRDGIFASDGNFAFDRGLQVFEAMMVFAGLAGIPLSWWLLGRSRNKPKRTG